MSRTVVSTTMLTCVFCACSADTVTPSNEETGASDECAAAGATTLVPDGTWPACPAASYTKVANNQPYATANAANVLDIYRPNTELGAYPTVIWIHGGGWEGGSKSNINQASWLLCEGYAVASVEYRLTSDPATREELEPPQPFPAQIQDVKAAIRYLRANAGTYHLDPERFVTFGSSAGGHLSALAATSGAVEALEDLAMGSSTASSHVRAAVDWFGPTWFSSMDEEILALAQQGVCDAGQATHGERTSGESKLCGCAVGEPSCAPAVALASPVSYVDANDPPLLLMHGDRDCVVPHPQSERLYQALTDAHACASLVIVNGAGHSNDTAAWLSASVRKNVLDFLNAALTTPIP